MQRLKIHSHRLLPGNDDNPEPISYSPLLAENFPEPSSNPITFDRSSDTFGRHQAQTRVLLVALLEAGDQNPASRRTLPALPDLVEFRSPRQTIGGRKTEAGLTGNQYVPAPSWRA